MYIINVHVKDARHTLTWVMDKASTCQTIKFLEETETVISYDVVAADGEFVDIVNEFGFGKTELKKGQ